LGQWYSGFSSSITVAGQWRIYTALPVSKMNDDKYGKDQFSLNIESKAEEINSLISNVI
jgi:hypothetical protein